MKYLFLAILVVLSGCSEKDGVDLAAVAESAVKACAKRDMTVKTVRYEISRVRVVCEDPDTLEYRTLRLSKPMLENTK